MTRQGVARRGPMIHTVCDSTVLGEYIDTDAQVRPDTWTALTLSLKGELALKMNFVFNGHRHARPSRRTGIVITENLADHERGTLLSWRLRNKSGSHVIVQTVQGQTRESCCSSNGSGPNQGVMLFSGRLRNTSETHAAVQTAQEQIWESRCCPDSSETNRGHAVVRTAQGQIGEARDSKI